jgi:hypothetical protein
MNEFIITEDFPDNQQEFDERFPPVLKGGFFSIANAFAD